MPPERLTSAELEIVDIARGPSDRITGHFQARGTDGPRLEIVGWVFGVECPATDVGVTVAGTVAGRVPVSLERPDVAERFPDVAEAVTAGFRIELAAQGSGGSELQIWVQLEDESREPLGRVVVMAGRRRLLG